MKKIIVLIFMLYMGIAHSQTYNYNEIGVYGGATFSKSVEGTGYYGIVYKHNLYRKGLAIKGYFGGTRTCYCKNQLGKIIEFGVEAEKDLSGQSYARMRKLVPYISAGPNIMSIKGNIVPNLAASAGFKSDITVRWSVALEVKHRKPMIDFFKPFTSVGLTLFWTN